MYQNGLAAYADGIGAHPGGYNVPPSVRWEEACSVIQQTGNTFNGACDTPHHSWSFRSTIEGYRNIMVVYGDANEAHLADWSVGPQAAPSTRATPTPTITASTNNRLDGRRIR